MVGVRHLGHVVDGGGACSWPVVVLDESAQALSGGGQVVFEFLDAALGVVGLGGVGVAFGEQLPGLGFEVGDSGDQFGRIWAVDLGAELQA